MRFAALLLVCSLLGAFFQICEAQQTATTLSKVVQIHATELLKDPRFGSVSVAVYCKGIEHTSHYGELDKGKKNSPTDRTLYELASVSKTITGFLVAKAVTEKKIKLSDPVTKFIGDKYENMVFDGFPVTIEHLLTHTSGLPLNFPGIDHLYSSPTKESYQKARDFLTQYRRETFLIDLRKMKLTRPPGTVYSYSNVAPNLLACILEKVYKEPFSKILQRKLFLKAGMKDTGINLARNDQRLLANGYNGSGQQMPSFRWPIKIWGGAGRVKSNSKDMLKYLAFQLRNENRVVLESRRKLYKDLENLWIGYFWEIVEDKSGRHIEHHGGLYGCQNWVLIFPKQKIGISIISNSSFPEANPCIKKMALDIFEAIQ